MLVTITNTDTDDVYVSMLYNSLDAGEAQTVRRTSAQLDAEYQLADLVAESKVEVSFVSEPTDGIIGAPGLLPSYSEEELPDPSTLTQGTVVWNSDDMAPIYASAEGWRDAAGTLT